MYDALVKDVRGVVAEIEQHVQARMLVLLFHKAVLNFPEDELSQPSPCASGWIRWVATAAMTLACWVQP